MRHAACRGRKIHGAMGAIANALIETARNFVKSREAAVGTVRDLGATQPAAGDFDEITFEEFMMGRDKLYAAQLTDQITENARETCRRWNTLLRAFFNSTSINHRGVRSGWRPPDVNARVPGAAPNSTHMLGLACDVEDPDKALAAFVVANPELVSTIGLWFEDPLAVNPDTKKTYTPTWVHGQTVPPKSGRRFYIPF